MGIFLKLYVWVVVVGQLRTSVSDISGQRRFLCSIVACVVLFLF